MRNAIAAGVFNDLGSGSNIDLCIITNGHVDYLRNYEIANVKPPIQTQYTFPRGTTGRRLPWCGLLALFYTNFIFEYPIIRSLTYSLATLTKSVLTLADVVVEEVPAGAMDTK